MESGRRRARPSKTHKEQAFLGPWSYGQFRRSKGTVWLLRFDTRPGMANAMLSYIHTVARLFGSFDLWPLRLHPPWQEILLDRRTQSSRLPRLTSILLWQSQMTRRRVLKMVSIENSNTLHETCMSPSTHINLSHTVIPSTLPFRHQGQDTLISGFAEDWCPRIKTVKAVYDILTQHRFVSVRGICSPPLHCV